MGLNNGILTLPISIGDIGTCLGTTVRDLGCLCSDRNGTTDAAGDVPRINKYAKYKPQPRIAQYGDITLAQRIADNWGLTLVTPNVSYLTAAQTSYEYLPTGTHFRATDFNNYAHGVGQIVTVPKTIRWKATTTKTIFATTDGGGLKLELSDFTRSDAPLASYYLALVFETTSGTGNRYIITADDDLSNNQEGYTMILPATSSFQTSYGGHTYTAYWVACSHKYTSWTLLTNVSSAARFLPLPLASAADAQVAFTIEAPESALLNAQLYVYDSVSTQGTPYTISELMLDLITSQSAGSVRLDSVTVRFQGGTRTFTLNQTFAVGGTTSRYILRAELDTLTDYQLSDFLLTDLTQVTITFNYSNNTFEQLNTNFECYYE